MKLSVNEGYFRKKRDGSRRTAEQAVRICADAGFDAVDLGFCGTTPAKNLIYRQDFRGEAEKLCAYCENLGIAVNQSHARYDYPRGTREEFIADLKKTVEASAILGAKNMVVHADTYYDPAFRFDFNTVLNAIYEVYAPVVEHAVKHGVVIAMETLFEDRAPQGKRARFTSYTEELEAIVGKFDDAAVGICWDFGHARVSYGEKQFEQMKKVGKKIVATHVHDNMASHDLHMFPYLGMTDWETGLKTLRDIGYVGDWTFELVYGCLPDEFQPDFAALLNRVGRYMINQILPEDTAKS